MNEEEYLQKFREESPRLEAWGEFIISTLNRALVGELGEDKYKDWVKIPPTLRMKSETSLIAKAFVLNEGWFPDIYNDIVDKVGVRFVMGLTDQIQRLSEIISDTPAWHAQLSREFDQWKSSDPRIFDYQSAHFVIESIEAISFGGVDIPPHTKCEIQIRTLLQHAYAELSHDTLYKSNITNDPEVHRLFAKSMALMETTDDMMLRARNTSVASQSKLDAIKSAIKEANRSFLPDIVFSDDARSNDYIIDRFMHLRDNYFAEDYVKFSQKYAPSLKKFIANNRAINPIFGLEVIPYVYFLAKYKHNGLCDAWEESNEILQRICYDMGVVPRWERD